MKLKKMLALGLALGLMLNSVPVLAAEDESAFEETFESAEEISELSDTVDNEEQQEISESAEEIENEDLEEISQSEETESEDAEELSAPSEKTESEESEENAAQSENGTECEDVEAFSSQSEEGIETQSASNVIDTYKYDPATKVLTISGNGPMRDYQEVKNDISAPWKFAAREATKIVIEDGVTHIGNFVFYRCESVKEIVIGDDVTSIGKYAFLMCNSLKKITIGKKVRTIGKGAFKAPAAAPEAMYISDLAAWYEIEFEDMYSNPFWGASNGSLYLNGEKVTEITVPDNVAEIKDFTFRGIRDLRKVVLNNKITRIGDTAFAGCSSLTEIEIPKSVTSIGENAFSGCSMLTDAVLPDTITRLEDNIFYGCTKLTHFEIPESVQYIGEAFAYCTGLTYMEIPENVTELGKYTFWQCSNLTRINLSSQLKSIGDYAFGYCTSLKEIRIPDNVVTIGTSTFENCTKLETVSLGKNVNTIGESAFENLASLKNVKLSENIQTIGMKAFMSCTGIKEISFPGSLKEIGNKAFSGCIGLSELKFGSELQTIGESAFSGCKNISQVTFEALQILMEKAFYGCSSLTEITFPKSLSEIKNQVFEACTNLKTITFEGSAPTFEKNAFSTVTAICWYTPDETWVPAILTDDFGGDLLWKYEGQKEDENFNKCGENITWTLSETGELKLSGSGKMSDYAHGEYKYAPWYEQRNKVKSIEIDDGITSIGADAFYGCSGITKAIIPERVESIGEYAFYNCSNVTEVVIPKRVSAIGQYAFSGCKLANVELPDNLEVISNRMFYDCKYLTNVKFPSKLKKIGDYAFCMCLGLNSVEIPEGVTEIGEGAFGNCGSDNWAGYYVCTNFVSVKLPSTLQVLGKTAFFNCSSLKTINIPPNLKEVKTMTFHHCYNLTEVIFEGGAPEIASDAFETVYKSTKSVLTYYYPGNNPTWTTDKFLNYGADRAEWKILEGTGSGGSGSGGTGEGTGSGSSGSDSGTGSGSGSGGSGTGSSGGSESGSSEGSGSESGSGSGSSSEGSGSESGSGSGTGSGGSGGESGSSSGTGSGESGGESGSGSGTGSGGSSSEGGNGGETEENKCGENIIWVLSDGVLTLSGNGEMSEYAHSESKYAPWYEQRNNVKSIKIGSGITSIGADAFYNCSNATEIEIPESVQTIGQYAFSGCKFANVELPDNLEVISDYMFYDCRYLINVKFPSKLKKIDDCAFLMCLGLNSVEIPEGVTEIGEEAFGNCGTDKWGWAEYVWTNFVSVKLPSTLQSLGQKAFAGCSSLKTINIPPNLKKVKTLTFYQCYNLTEVTFEWEVPEIAADAFRTVYKSTKSILTYYYPGNNPAWTSDKRLNYGADRAQWIAREMPEPSEGSGTEKEFEFSAHSLTLNGDIGVNFYVELDEAILNDSTAVMEMNVAGKQKTTIKVSDAVKKGFAEVKDKEGNTHQCYKFTCNVYAKQMTDKITATLKTSSGSWKELYSVQDYVDTVQNSSNEKLKNLVNAMAVYGGYAQQLFGYNTNNLAGGSLGDISGVTKDMLTGYGYTGEGTEEKLSFYGASLLLKEQTTIRMYYQLAEGNIEDYRFTVDGKTVQPIKSGESNTYYIELNNIAAQDLENTHVFTAGNIIISNYSALSYVNKALDSEKSSENNKKTVAALYLYWKAAEEYFA